jgi:hypothetical protein
MSCDPSLFRLGVEIDHVASIDYRDEPAQWNILLHNAPLFFAFGLCTVLKVVGATVAVSTFNSRDHNRDPTSMSDHVHQNEGYKYPSSKQVDVCPFAERYSPEYICIHQFRLGAILTRRNMFSTHNGIPRDSAYCKAQEGQGIDQKVDASPSAHIVLHFFYHIFYNHKNLSF